MSKITVNIASIYNVVKKEYRQHRMPVVELIQLQNDDPYRVLVATIMSARTKDQTTAAAAARLFAKAPSLKHLARLTVGRIEKCIYPVGFWQQKSLYLKDLPGKLNRLFGGTIPDTVDELVRLPGVGRKTANLVVAIAFDKPAICVDIHVHRICNRLGYVTTKTPLETEMTLRKILPLEYWTTINSYLVSFGQNTCTPRNPKCNTCPIHEWCHRCGVTTRHHRLPGPDV